MADPAADYLRTLNTSDRARAAAWDAVYAKDDATADTLLRQLPFSDDVRADLWDIRQGASVSGGSAPKPAATEDFMEPAQAPQGSAVGRFVGGVAEQLNPIAMAKGVYQAVTSPLETGRALFDAQAQQFGQAREAFAEGRVSEGLGHGAAAFIPVIGPAAAGAGEQIASGDVAGGLGTGLGLMAATVGPRARTVARETIKLGSRVAPRTAERVAAASERGARARVADVMSPRVGPNKTRFGNQAEKVAPALARDLAQDGAPLTREGFHGRIGQKLSEAEAALDAATDARNANQVIHTRPIVRALQRQRETLIAQTHRVGTFKAGKDVIPAHNAHRVAELDRAMVEVSQLGPVANYEALRRLRQAYDGPAKAVHTPSMTADYLKAQGGKLGAADVTSVLRDSLAKMDPKTAAANAGYHIYRTADDVLEATREVERTRPRVGRAIMARLTGTLIGGQAAGVPGAVAGYVGGPLVDQALASGFTTKLKTAAALQRLADAIRAGDVDRVNTLTTRLQKELRAAGRATRAVPVQIEQATEAAATRTAGSPEDRPPALAQR